MGKDSVNKRVNPVFLTGYLGMVLLHQLLGMALHTTTYSYHPELLLRLEPV